jgi:hypothetical protein
MINGGILNFFTNKPFTFKASFFSYSVELGKQLAKAIEDKK